jgi:quercetin dioxygenase-like cupin family protein
MRNTALVILAIIAASCAQNDPSRARGEKRDRPQMRRESAASNGPAHQIIRPEELKWQNGPPSLPPGAQSVVLEGDPEKRGFFATRLKLPAGYSIPPHIHPNIERITVISGKFNLGMGETFDKSRGQALPAGTYLFMQPGMQHFAWADEETIVQLTTIGPWKIKYVNPTDDPRGSSASHGDKETSKR